MNRLVQEWKDDAHAVAHLGAIDASLWSLRAALDAAGRDINADPIGTPGSRQQRALRVRHVVDATVGEILDRITRALGPGPLADTPDLHRHIVETNLYRRQSHAERDLETLGHIAEQSWANASTGESAAG